jgi:hypothetical protein
MSTVEAAGLRELEERAEEDQVTRLYAAVLMDYARHVHRAGFIGRPEVTYETEKLALGEDVAIHTQAFCEFRDMPPAGLTFSLTAEAQVEERYADTIEMTISGGPVLADEMGDLVLSILVPDGEIREYEIHEDPPQGWPFREYRLPVDVANKYRHSLEVWVPESEEQIPVDLLSQDHAVIVTERFDFVISPGDDFLDASRTALTGELTPEQTEMLEAERATIPAGALCVCGERWRWDGVEDQAAAFASWSSRHLP